MTFETSRTITSSYLQTTLANLRRSSEQQKISNQPQPNRLSSLAAKTLLNQGEQHENDHATPHNNTHWQRRNKENLLPDGTAPEKENDNLLVQLRGDRPRRPFTVLQENGGRTVQKVKLAQTRLADLLQTPGAKETPTAPCDFDAIKEFLRETYRHQAVELIAPGLDGAKPLAEIMSPGTFQTFNDSISRKLKYIDQLKQPYSVDEQNPASEAVSELTLTQLGLDKSPQRHASQSAMLSPPSEQSIATLSFSDLGLALPLVNQRDESNDDAGAPPPATEISRQQPSPARPIITRTASPVTTSMEELLPDQTSFVDKILSAVGAFFDAFGSPVIPKRDPMMGLSYYTPSSDDEVDD